MTLREKAKNNGTIGLFQSKQSSEYGTAEKQVSDIITLFEVNIDDMIKTETK